MLPKERIAYTSCGSDRGGIADAIDCAAEEASGSLAAFQVSPAYPALSLRCILRFGGNASERFPTFQTEPLGAGCDQSAKRAHPLSSDLLRLWFEYAEQLFKEGHHGNQMSAAKEITGFIESPWQPRPPIEFISVPLTMTG